LRTDRLLVLVFAAIVSACNSRPIRPAAVPAVPARAPQLKATRFVAFGDSITEGFVQKCPGEAENPGGAPEPPGAGRGLLMDPLRSQPSPTAYTVRLQALLSERYQGQSITVVNEGSGGEEIEAGARDLPRVLTEHAPEVLLLQEGINTLNTRHEEGVAIVVESLRGMVREARKRGIVVFLGTLLPQRPGSCRAYDAEESSDDIVPTNVELRRLAGLEGAELVDLYEVFVGRTATLIGQDGLHPSAAGYAAIADAFFAAIREHLEQ
jgi:lysophospholipase L1-like esterase